MLYHKEQILAVLERNYNKTWDEGVENLRLVLGWLFFTSSSTRIKILRMRDHGFSLYRYGLSADKISMYENVFYDTKN